MSPHAIQVESLDEIDLTKYAVTENAFLPQSSPPTILSDSYYEPWETIASQLSTLIDNGTIREAVAQMPVLNTDALVDEPEWRRAYCILAYMTHAYVWGGDKPEAVSFPLN